MRLSVFSSAHVAGLHFGGELGKRSAGAGFLRRRDPCERDQQAERNEHAVCHEFHLLTSDAERSQFRFTTGVG